MKLTEIFAFLVFIFTWFGHLAAGFLLQSHSLTIGYLACGHPSHIGYAQ